MEMTGDNNENYEAYTFIEIPFRKRKMLYENKTQGFLKYLSQ
jgi:hypothetical protein